jgi:hypothetical protein
MGGVDSGEAGLGLGSGTFDSDMLGLEGVIGLDMKEVKVLRRDPLRITPGRAKLGAGNLQAKTISDPGCRLFLDSKVKEFIRY